MGFHFSLFPSPSPSPYESFDYASVRLSARHVHSRRRLRHQSSRGAEGRPASGAPYAGSSRAAHARCASSLEDALTDQIAWLENAAEDDKADAEASGEPSGNVNPGAR